MRNQKVREVYYYKRYFLDFFEKLNPLVQEKVEWTIKLVETLERVPTKYFKHISGSDGIYEIRVAVKSDIFRIFCFFDQGSIVILMNGFQKKSQKTPRKDLNLAEKIKKQYQNEK